jgi:TolB protein
VRFASRSLEKGKLLIEGECINLETGAVVLKKNFMGETAAAGRMAHRLVDFMVGKVTGTSGVADSTIVVARSTGPGIKELFRLDRDGGNPRQITSFGSLTTHPAVAADGKLAFVTYKGGPPQIWGQSQPNGPFQRLYPPPGASGLELSGLAWSPDGGRLCFVQENRKGLSDIHLLDLRSGVEAQLTPGGRSSRGPCWNASGTEIAYLSDQDGTPQVYIMAADGTRARRLTADPAPKDGVAWNAQGDRIGFVARQDGRIGLYTVSPSGADCRKLASSPDPVESLCWSPDGRWLLLGLKARDGSRLCAAGLDGRLQDLDASPGGGQFPQWTQDPIALASLPPAGTSPALPGPAPVGATSLP